MINFASFTQRQMCLFDSGDFWPGGKYFALIPVPKLDRLKLYRYEVNDGVNIDLNRSVNAFVSDLTHYFTRI